MSHVNAFVKLKPKRYGNCVIRVAQKNCIVFLSRKNNGLITKSVKLYSAIILIILFWASAYIGIRAGLQGYSPGPLALFRYLIASACMFFIYWRTLNFRRIPWRDVA